ncbi:uncharacterized protein LOC131436938 [Malaya genurostris]|uniref:uncharacterized protein LOC131436938 n=1 Tax=Malaya genurostris TaxID=325434 RepID=UPI0026F3C3DD|nr:uncharacterized protein LOC131436938 [Malaya genurostris]
MCRITSLIVVALVLGSCQARTVPIRSKQAVKAYSYVLPAGAEEIRDDINHSFVCANRTDGFYVDIDNDCQIFHRCQDRARFSFICAEKTVFSQMYQTCVHDGHLGFPCEDSASFFPDSEGNTNTKSENTGDAGKLSTQTSTVASIPSQELVAPEESQKPDATDAADDEQPAGSVLMPVSDNFFNVIDNHQLNADTFDPVEESESENTAQEVIDQADDSSTASENQATLEITDSTQEVEISDEDREADNHDKESKLEEENTQNPATNEIVLDNNDKQVVSGSADESLDDSQSSLQNNIQTVEEPEPIIHDFQEVELAASSLNTNDEVVTDLINTKPLDTTDVAIIVTEPEINSINDGFVHQPHLDNSVTKIEPNDDSEEESEQKVGELFNVESSIDEHKNNPANEPVAEVLKPEETEQSTSVVATASQAANHQTSNEIHPLIAATLAERLAAEPSRINLPEFIVSTVADLRKGVPSPALRRRKTFLFKADAIST